MVKHDLKIISFNVRGLNNVKKRVSIFKHLQKNQCDIAFLQETYSSVQDTNKWLQEWGGKGFFVHGTKHSRGVAVFFRKNLGIDVIDKILDSKGRFIILKIKSNEIHFNLINIYAPNKEKDQILFLNDLKSIMEANNIHNTDNNIIAGDWNISMGALDKSGGAVYSKTKACKAIEDLSKQYDLVDIWRQKNETKKRYTWRQKNPRIHCRLDYFLISQHTLDFIIEANILPSVLSDHSPISLCIKHLDEPKLGCGHWKLNVSLLSDETYLNKMKDNFLIWDEQYHDVNYNLKWELFKYEIRKFTIAFSKTKKRTFRKRKETLEYKLCELEKLEYQNDETILKEIDNTRDELNKMLLEEAEEAIIRSRAQWAEEGEKSTSYFFNLEKQNALKKNIRKIVKNKKEITDQNQIMECIKEYYMDLYKEESVDLLNTDIFIQPHIPKLTINEQKKCEGLITIEECLKVVKKISKNKSPGNDGLPIEFYLKFWNEIGLLLVNSYNYSFENKLLTISQRQAIISLIDKPGKDRLHIKNWRPISLLNIDYKILTKCLTERLKDVLENIIDQSQTGFVKGRNIADGLRTILDIVEETKRSEKEGLLVTIDFEKAFDSLSWEYLFKALETFNFGEDFLKWIKICYTDIYSCVTNFKNSSSYFSVKRGVRQGDSLSPYLFIIAVELMSINIRNNNAIRGLQFDNYEIKILSYADDTTAILKDETDAKKLFDFLKMFETVSGLKMNKDKTEGLWLGWKRNSNFKPLGIKWPSIIKILGIHISYDKQLSLEKNFKEKVAKVKMKLDMWKQRNLTIFGKILIIKTFALSQILYVATVLHVPEETVKEIESLSYQFLWNGSQHKVKKRVVIQDYQFGGCKMVDCEEMFKVQKIKWIQKYFVEKEKYWKLTMRELIGKQNLNVFLSSNFTIPPNISPFYTDLLKYWKEIKFEQLDSSDDILDQYLWYNKAISINRKSIFSKHFIDKGIVQLKHIVNKEGVFKTFEDLIAEFEINKKYVMLYRGIVNAIPTVWTNKIRGKSSNNFSSQCFINLNNNKVDIIDAKYDKIYSHLVFKKHEKSKACLKYTNKFGIDEEEWKTIYLMASKVGVSNKAKENQYKIMHDYVPTNKLLFKMKIIDSPRCNFCNLYVQDTYHLFFDCLIVKTFGLQLLSGC